MTNKPLLSPKQMWSIHKAKSKKIALWVGAVSGGKTIASLFAFLDAVADAKGSGEIFIIGKTLQAIERNIIHPLQSYELFGELAYQVVHVKGSNDAMIFGRLVSLVGANDARAEGRIRGATAEIAYVDEATLLAKEFWAMLITRLRVSGARMLATTNPGASQHWLRTDYILDPEANNMVVFHFTMHDNPLYFEGGDPGPAYIADMESTFAGSKIFYDRFIKGLWTNAEGAIYDNWDPAKHVIAWSDMPPMYSLLGVAMDFGTQHATSIGILGLGYDRRLYMVDELRIDVTDTATRQSPSVKAKTIADWLKLDHTPERQGLRPLRVIASTDPASIAHTAELYQSQGIATEHAENAVSYGIGLISSLLSREIDGIPMLRVSDRCTGIIQEAPSYTWDPKAAERGEDAPIKANDDSMDMWRYAIATTEGDWRDELLTINTRF
ncbi:MAG TPA: terminase family protein [Galbitalea sp.]|jgi:PBSX family phage terminase large subunit